MRFRLLGASLRDIRALAGALFFGAGIALVTTSAQTVLDYRNAIELPGIITAKELVRADRKGNPSTRFVARYRVDLPDGETVSAAVDLPRPEWEARSVGGAYPVLYLSAERRALPPAGLAEYIGGAIVGLLGVVFAILGAVLLAKPLRVLRARVRLLQRGVRANATVSEVFPTSNTLNGVPLWQLRYRYRDASGAERAGESDLLLASEAENWDPGAIGAVLYDSVDPGHSAWLGTLPEIEQKKPRPLLRMLRNLALFFAALFVAGVVGELFPALKALESWMAQERAPLLYATGGAALLGVFLLVGAALALLMERGEPLSHQEIEQHQRAMRDAAALGYARRISSYRLFGVGAGAAGHEEFPLRDLKRAFASGAVLRDSAWRRRAVALLGAALIFAGLLGIFIVISPLALKLVLAAVVLYACTRTALAFALA